ncbi:hypothetical protein KDL45_14955 [bacterium]|nr:hypothetical protein [bacterium]
MESPHRPAVQAINVHPTGSTIIGYNCPACGCQASELVSSDKRMSSPYGFVSIARLCCESCGAGYTATTNVNVTLDSRTEEQG